ncbi:MAG: GreA/GreB family elongation factor [Flavisolibacter sp.]|nr:GreA/GreB family elongation factor [Flavisolibacter sp.]
MLTIENKKRIVAKEDHLLLTEYLKKNKVVNGNKADSMLHVVENAELLENGDFPWEVVRLNSRVIIRDKVARLNYTYTVVMPELADHKQCKVSVFSEIGSALFGNSRGNDIYWKTPKGKRYFTIMAVSQYDYK